MTGLVLWPLCTELLLLNLGQAELINNMTTTVK